VAGFRLELNKASTLILAVGGQFGQAKFAGSCVRYPPGHATRFDQKSRSLTTASSLGLTLRNGPYANVSDVQRITQHLKTNRRARKATRQSPVLLQMVKLLKGSVDQKKESPVHGRKAN